MATALRARPLSVGRSCVLPRDRSVAHRATAIDANWSTRTEGNAPCAERRATRRPLRNHLPPGPSGGSGAGGQSNGGGP